MGICPDSCARGKHEETVDAARIEFLEASGLVARYCGGALPRPKHTGPGCCCVCVRTCVWWGRVRGREHAEEGGLANAKGQARQLLRSARGGRGVQRQLTTPAGRDERHTQPSRGAALQARRKWHLGIVDRDGLIAAAPGPMRLTTEIVPFSNQHRRPAFTRENQPCILPTQQQPQH